jgi:hypothetical protein
MRADQIRCHRRGGYPVRSGHRPATPARFALRRLMQRRADDLIDLRERDRRLAAPARTPSVPLAQTAHATPSRSPATPRPPWRSGCWQSRRPPSAALALARHSGAPRPLSGTVSPASKRWSAYRQSSGRRAHTSPYRNHHLVTRHTTSIGQRKALEIFLTHQLHQRRERFRSSACHGYTLSMDTCHITRPPACG